MDNTSYMNELLGIYNSISQDKRVEFVSRVTPRLKNPTAIFGFSVFLGYWGIDRFLLGQTLLGVLKIFTLGGLGIWVIIDWFIIAGKARDMNIEVAREVAQSI
jgi:TM2 domain-containing membrane protein YozV